MEVWYGTGERRCRFVMVVGRELASTVLSGGEYGGGIGGRWRASMTIVVDVV